MTCSGCRMWSPRGRGFVSVWGPSRSRSKELPVPVSFPFTRLTLSKGWAGEISASLVWLGAVWGAADVWRNGLGACQDKIILVWSRNQTFGRCLAAGIVWSEWDMFEAAWQQLLLRAHAGCGSTEAVSAYLLAAMQHCAGDQILRDRFLISVRMHLVARAYMLHNYFQMERYAARQLGLRCMPGQVACLSGRRSHLAGEHDRSVEEMAMGRNGSALGLVMLGQGVLPSRRGYRWGCHVPPFCGRGCQRCVRDFFMSDRALVGGQP
ncbi:hypothetical protein QBC34DRAFT_154339 [Podospora aff. communis PSN243]|uniref:Uncharacterized protein n=1 Tax=Podospora aff. communis PSN243 TaxID=3040156 RepID=A0AAV9GBW1_9PEZI|nr:hypothetical protein QBC34DRAFT_154339 [Podospora aff. communis PSN243]